MQSADNMEFRDAESERLAGLLDYFLDGELETIGVAFLSGEGAELAAQDAVIRVVDVAIDDVAGAVTHLALPGKVGNRTDGIQILALEQAQGVGFGNPFAGGDFLVKVAEFAVLEKKLHKLRLAERAGLANRVSGEDQPRVQECYRTQKPPLKTMWCPPKTILWRC